MRNSLLITLCLFAIHFANAQEQTLLRGAVTETTVTNDSLDISYSIYLPQNYDPEKLAKALFVFDPEGEGTKAARLFASGLQGEDFVIVSNNHPMSSTIDSLDANADNALLIVRDVFRKIAVDKYRVYFSGLKGGAKTASALSYLFKSSANLLLIDDMYFANRFANQAQRNLAIGVIGKASPNFYPMEDYFYMLKAYGKNNELYTYDDTSEWPSAALLGTLVKRLDHLNVEHYNLKVEDSVWQRQASVDLNTVQGLINDGQLVVAYDLVRDLKGDYRGEVDLDPIREVQRSLRRSDAYKQAKCLSRKDEVQEGLLLDDISYFLEEDLALGNFKNLGYWDDRILQFKTAAQNPAKPIEQKVARRMLGYIDYTVKDFLALNRVALYDQRIFANVLKTILDPDDYYAYLDIISLAAQDEDENTAFFYLEELLKQGYTDYDKLYDIPDTEFVKIKPVYNQLIESYLGKSKF